MSTDRAVQDLKKTASPLKGQVGSIIFTVVEFLVFLFVVIATPIQQFKPRGNIGYNVGWYGSTGLNYGQYKNHCTDQQNTAVAVCASTHATCKSAPGCDPTCSMQCDNNYNSCVNNANIALTNCINNYNNNNGGYGYNWAGYGAKSCWTVWGLKYNCGSTTYNLKWSSAFGCGQRRNNMNGAAAFALASIVISLIALIYGVMMILGSCQSRVVPLVLSLLAMATLLVSWACVAGVYNNNMCNCNGCFYSGKFKYYAKYGAGFTLLILSWVLQVINCVLAVVLMVL